MFSENQKRRQRRPGKGNWGAVSENATLFHKSLLSGNGAEAYFRHPVLEEYLLHEDLRPTRAVVSLFIRSEIRFYLRLALHELATQKTSDKRTESILATAFPDARSADLITPNALTDFSNRRYSLRFPVEPVHNWARVLKGRRNDVKKIEAVADAWLRMLASIAIAGIPYRSQTDDGSSEVERAIVGLDAAANRSMKRYGIQWDSRLITFLAGDDGGNGAQKRSPRPDARLIRNPQEAEMVAAEWIRYWGWPDAKVSKAGADEGIDVEGTGVVAQVKAHMVPIGRPDIQNLVGVASVIKKMPVFFSLTDYTPQAVSWADLAGVALFGFDLQGTPKPINAAAIKIAQR